MGSEMCIRDRLLDSAWALIAGGIGGAVVAALPVYKETGYKQTIDKKPGQAEPGHNALDDADQRTFNKQGDAK